MPPAVRSWRGYGSAAGLRLLEPPGDEDRLAGFCRERGVAVLVASLAAGDPAGAERFGRLRAALPSLPLVALVARGGERLARAAGAQGWLVREELDPRLARLVLEQAAAQRPMLCALEEAERQRTLFESTNDAIYIHDLEGRFLEVNRVACERLGYSREEYLAMTPRDIDTERYAALTPGRMQLLMARGSALFEAEHRSRDGRVIPIELSTRLIEFRGAPALISIARDISERKLAEQALRESEAKLREAHAIARLGRWELDLADGCLQWSDTIYQIFEIDPRQFDASYEAFLAAIHPEDRAAVDRTYRESVLSRTSYDITHRLLMPDGRVKWVNEIGRTDYDARGQAIRSVGIVQDISERIRAEQALRESEERFRRIFDLSPLGVAVIGLDYRYQQVNDRFCQITGYSAEELRHKTLEQITHPGDREADQEAARQLLAGAIDSYQADKRYLRKEGGAVWVGVSVRLVRDSQGRPQYFLPLIEDITERKRAEEILRRANDELEERVHRRTEELSRANAELRHSRGKLARAQRMAGLGSWDWNLENDAVEWSEEVFRILGYQPGSFVPAIGFYRSHLHPADRERVEQAVQAALEGRGRFDLEYRIIRADGEERVVFGTAEVECGPEDRPLRVTGTIQDITQLRRAQQALLEEQAKLEAMLEQKSLLAEIASRLNSTATFRQTLSVILDQIALATGIGRVGMYTLDPEDGRSERLGYQLSPGCAIEPDSEHEPCWFRVPGLREKLSEEVTMISLARGQSTGMAREILERQGQEALDIFPIRVQDRTRGCLCLCQPLGRKAIPGEFDLFRTIANMLASNWEKERQFQARIEAEEKQTEAVRLAERASRLASIGEMAAGITHEINQPLNAIKVTVDSILYWSRNNPGQLPELFTGKLGKISDGVTRIDEIIRHMRAFWTRRNEPPAELLELNERVRSALSLTERQLESHGIALELEPSPEPLMVRGNRVHLEQVAGNLLVNAVQALEELGGRRPPRLRVATFTEDLSAVLEVSDNGPGLPGQQGADVFDPFFTTKREGEGTGLGLAIVRRFVERYGGTVTARNNSEGGATFTVRLPLAQYEGQATGHPGR